MKICYIDETETKEYFIVCAMIANSQAELETSFKSFKKKAKSLSSNLKEKEKRILFNEFKFKEMDGKYPTIKRAMLNYIDLLDCNISYSYQKKSTEKIKKQEKISLYISAIHEAIDVFDYDMKVIFDFFKDKEFENHIIESFIAHPHVISIQPGDSKMINGLKYVDNICSVIRYKINNNDKHNYYYLIEDKIIK